MSRKRRSELSSGGQRRTCAVPTISHDIPLNSWARFALPTLQHLTRSTYDARWAAVITMRIRSAALRAPSFFMMLAR